MWLLATYQPTTFFSLRPSNTTSSGGKTLLLPTPFSIKMALLDIAIRTQGLAKAETHWALLRDLNVAVQLPERAVVNNVFARLLKPTRIDSAEETVEEKGAFTRTIGYREYVHFVGAMTLGLEVKSKEAADCVEALLQQLNYLGKRGSFLQFIPPVDHAVECPEGFTLLQKCPGVFHIDSQLQLLDDCNEDTMFDQVNVFSPTKADRKQLLGIVPYRLKRSSRAFSDYERISNAKHELVK